MNIADNSQAQYDIGVALRDVGFRIRAAVFRAAGRTDSEYRGRTHANLDGAVRNMTAWFIAKKTFVPTVQGIEVPAVLYKSNCRHPRTHRHGP